NTATTTLVYILYLHDALPISDCDYVDGEVLERNWGERDHSWVQGIVTAHFVVRRKEWKISVLPEMRVQVKPTRFRIPDICIVLEIRRAHVCTQAPLQCRVPPS